MQMINNHHEQVLFVLNNVFGKDAEFRGIEIGTKAGDLTKALLHNFPKLRLATIDPWKHQEGEEFEAGNSQEYHNAQRDAALHKLKEFFPRIEVYQMTSDEYYEKWGKKTSTVDFVWIDGHHTRDQVYRDIDNYKKLVVPHGLIGGHDYGLVPGVKDVVDKSLDEIHSGKDFTWWVYM